MRGIDMLAQFVMWSRYPCASTVAALLCLASTSRRLQKEAPSRGYRVTESDERARSVTEREKYHRVVPGRPHKAQTFTPGRVSAWGSHLFTPLTHSVHWLPGSIICEYFRARAFNFAPHAFPIDVI